MQPMERKNAEAVTAFIENLANRYELYRTDQFFAGQIEEAFTGRHYAIEELLVQAEKVTARIVITGTHSGRFAGNAPTGRTVRITQFREFRVEDGIIVAHRGWFDTGTLLPQLQEGMSSIEQQNAETVTAFIEAFWNGHDMGCTDRFLSDDYRELSYGSEEGLKQFAAKIGEAFPDKRYTVEEIVAQGEKVLVRMVVKGTHLGMFFGKAPTGNKIEVTLYRQYRVVDRKIAEHRGWIDTVTMQSQLGAS